MSEQKVDIINIDLFYTFFLEGAVCRNNESWCRFMTKDGACKWNDKTKLSCQRTCGLCNGK